MDGSKFCQFYFQFSIQFEVNPTLRHEHAQEPNNEVFLFDFLYFHGAAFNL